MKRLQECCEQMETKAPLNGRGRCWQRPQRQLQANIRRRAVEFGRWSRQRARTLVEAARRLRLSPRTLRQWGYACRPEPVVLPSLGRPPIRSGVRLRQEVIKVLKSEGPRVGVLTLCQCFPDLARAELTDLLRRYRRVLQQRYHDMIQVLHWQVPGRVWTMDFAEPSELGADSSLPAIDGLYPYLLAVRDLASGYQLAWLPLREATEEEVRRVLAMHFAQWGAPLVLKSDNGGPFRAEETKKFLSQAGVMGLFSPPHLPAYNGTCEASIGSMKRRTELQAARQGRVGFWIGEDVETARAQANGTARYQNPIGPTPAEVWAKRTAIRPVERVRFELAVQRQRFQARTDARIGVDEELDHWAASELDRKAIPRALVEHGYLLYSRRRIPLRNKSRKAANNK